VRLPKTWILQQCNLGSETPRTQTTSYGIRAKKRWPKKDYWDKKSAQSLMSLKIQQKKFHLLAHQSTARTSRMMQNHTFSPYFLWSPKCKSKSNGTSRNKHLRCTYHSLIWPCWGELQNQQCICLTSVWGLCDKGFERQERERESIYPVASRVSLNNNVVVMGETPVAHMLITWDSWFCVLFLSPR
jgi:hypothetical protein